MLNQISIGLTILWKGMLGIFAVSVVLILFIILINCLTADGKEKKDTKQV